MADSVDLDQIPQTGVWSRDLGLQSLQFAQACLTWVYSVYSNLSNRILKINMVDTGTS